GRDRVDLGALRGGPDPGQGPPPAGGGPQGRRAARADALQPGTRPLGGAGLAAARLGPLPPRGTDLLRPAGPPVRTGVARARPRGRGRRPRHLLASGRGAAGALRLDVDATPRRPRTGAP